jgi:hypothetical protein
MVFAPSRSECIKTGGDTDGPTILIRWLPIPERGHPDTRWDKRRIVLVHCPFCRVHPHIPKQREKTLPRFLTGGDQSGC